MFRPQLCAPSLPSPKPFQLTAAFARSPCLCHSSAALLHAQVSMCACLSPCEPKFSDLNGCRSDLHPPISACSFDVLVQLSRKLRPIRCPIVPSSVRVSQNFLTQMDAASGVLLCSHSSGISVPLLHAQVSLCSSLSRLHQTFPAQVDAASAIAFCLDALIYHSSALSRSGLQFCPPQCARAKISEPNGCRSENCNLHFPMRCFGLLALPF